MIRILLYKTWMWNVFFGYAIDQIAFIDNLDWDRVLVRS